jgi:hypothetical protein
MPLQVFEVARGKPLDSRSWINTDLAGRFGAEFVCEQYPTVVLKRDQMGVERRVIGGAQTEAVVPVKATTLVLAPRDNV